MEYVTIKNGTIILPKDVLNIEYLRESGTITLPIVQNQDLSLHGYTLEIRLNLNNPVKSIYNDLIELFPEISNILDRTFVNYGECIFDINLIFSLMWIYKFYYNYNVNLFLPKISESYLQEFNAYFIKDQKYFINECDTITISLEALEQYELPYKRNSKNVTIFGYADLIFKDITQRRLNTQLKKIIKKGIVHIFSYTSLIHTGIACLDDIQRYEFINKPLINFKSMFESISLIDLLDKDPDTYESNESNFVDLVHSLVSEGKRIYMSLNMTLDKLKSIESQIKTKGVSISRKDNCDSSVVINSSKTTRNNVFLKGKYSVYILIFENNVDIVNYLKFIGNVPVEIYFDSSKIKNIEKCISEIYEKKTPKENFKVVDSEEYNNYEDCKCKDPVLVNEYYLFDSTESLKKLNLSNLSKNDYDIIRNYVKIKLLNKYSLDIHTCQLTTPCSPKDRPGKLNSLANKISSFDYRCDVTCEIFKDYTIGVLVWNETFSDRGDLDLGNLVGTNYVYQTTNGKWKITSIN
jgi:hypothetical protein